MLHPSYSDLMKVVNSEVEPGGSAGGQQQVLYRDGYFQKGKADHCRGRRTCECKER